MKCQRCGYDDLWTGDSAHVCQHPSGGRYLKSVIAEMESTPEGKAALNEGRKWAKETFYGEARSGNK